MDFQAIWETVKTYFSENIWNILLFFAVLIVGLILITLLNKLFRKIMSKTKMERVTQKFIANAIKLGLYLILVLILLNIVGVEITGILTALSAVLLAIGMALQNNIANFANGIIIVSAKLYKSGDLISVSGVEGRIEEIHFLYTVINTTDNKRIVIPNSIMINDVVINSGANSTRRVGFTFQVGYESDVEQVKSIIIKVMESCGMVIINEQRQPFCRLENLGASSLEFCATCWCDTEDYWDVYYYVVENVFNEFKRNGINVPYSQMELRVRNDDVTLPYNKEALPVRVEKERKVDEEIHSLEDLLDQGAKIIKKRKKKEK